ncbi:MAG: GNAT family N-acetyltransferase, partial [Heyndrickxia sp.]
EIKNRFNKKLLKEVLYKERRLIREGDLSYVKVVTEEDIEPVMNTFFQLHCKRWENTDTPSKFKNQLEREHAMLAAKSLFNSNLLNLTYIKHNDEIVAVHFGMTDGKKSYLYLHAINVKYNKYSPGSLLAYYLIQEACKEGYEIVDFLRGDEGYKEKWGTNEKRNVKYIIYNHSLKSQMYKKILIAYKNKKVYSALQKLTAIRRSVFG